MPEHMHFSLFHGYGTLSYPYVVTLLFMLGLPHYLGAPLGPPNMSSNVLMGKLAIYTPHTVCLNIGYF